MIRALGRAWVESDRRGGWRRRRGAPVAGALTEAQAAARMVELVADHDAEQSRLEADADERRRRGVTFRELASEWMEYLEREKGAKPSTLRDYRWLLAEPGQEHRRGSEHSRGLLLQAFGDSPAAAIITKGHRRLPSPAGPGWRDGPNRQQAPPSAQRHLWLRHARGQPPPHAQPGGGDLKAT